MTYDKPLPTLRGEERIWFDGAREGRAIYQHCADCGQDVFYTRALCPNCWSEKLEERIASGGGTVYSFTVQRRPGPPSPTRCLMPWYWWISTRESVCSLTSLTVPPRTSASECPCGCGSTT